jgi:hypothetical protein
LPSLFELVSLPLATRFDFPLSSENGAFAYNAQRFTETHHLGRVREKTNGWLDPSALIQAHRSAPPNGVGRSQP